MSSNSNMVKHIDELGFLTTHLYDGLSRMTEVTFSEGNKMQWTYDSKRNVLTETRVPKPGSPLSNITRAFTYHPTWNKVATEQDGLGNITTYSYSATTGNLLSITRPVVDGQTPQVVFTHNSRGQVLTRQDETGIVTRFEYDSTTEKLNQVTQDFGTGRLNLLTVLGYNSRGDVTSVQDPRGNSWSFTFDDKRRAMQKMDPAPFSYLTKLSYDKNDNLKKVERETGIPATPWQAFEATFNANNQLLTLKDPLNHTTSRQYDDLRRLWKQTDEMNRTTEFLYDARSDLWKVINSASIVEQTITYSANGLKTNVTDARNNTTQMTFDGLDREDKTIYADSTFEQNSLYDANDNILTKLVRSGDSIVMTYDTLNRRKTKAPQGQPTVTFFYDLAGRMTKASTPVISGNPASGDFEFFFDTAARLFKERNPDGKEVTFQLDQNANVTRLIYPDGYFTDRVYDQLNRLTDIKLNGATTSAAHFDYDALSRRTKLTYGNGTSIDYSFQLDDTLSQLLHTFNGSTLSFDYGYNLARQLISQTSSKKEHIWTPSSGNTTTYGTANNLNEYPTVGATSLTYNANGCLTNDGNWQFGYDIENHLLSATNGMVSASYVYDPMHRQIQKSVGSTKFRSFYSLWQRIADYDGITDAVQTRYVYGAGLDEPLIQVSNTGDITCLHVNQLSSITTVTNSTGVVVSRHNYSPWGETNGSAPTIRFAGHCYESDISLYNFKNRYYSPSLGRFLQPDPSGYRADTNVRTGYYSFDNPLRLPGEDPTGEFASLNLYNYAQNDPTNMIDPSGLSPLGVVATVVVAVVGGIIIVGANDATTAGSAAANSHKPGPHNGPQDAFRHCVWSCLMTKHLGSQIAEMITNAYEFIRPSPIDEKLMDQKNNRIGREAAACGGDCVKQCNKRCRQGKLTWMAKWN